MINFLGGILSGLVVYWFTRRAVILALFLLAPPTTVQSLLYEPEGRSADIRKVANNIGWVVMMFWTVGWHR